MINCVPVKGSRGTPQKSTAVLVSWKTNSLGLAQRHRQHVLRLL